MRAPTIPPTPTSAGDSGAEPVAGGAAGRQRHRLVDRGIDRDSGRPEKINAGSTSDRSNREKRYRSHTPVPLIRGCRSYSCGNANTT